MSVPGIIVLGDIFTACFAPDERQAVGVGGEVRKLLQEDLDLVLLPQMIEELEGAWKCSEIGAALTSELAAGTPRADRHFDPLVVRHVFMHFLGELSADDVPLVKQPGHAAEAHTMEVFCKKQSGCHLT